MHILVFTSLEKLMSRPRWTLPSLNTEHPLDSAQQAWLVLCSLAAVESARFTKMNLN